MLFRNADTGERFVALGANAFALLTRGERTRKRARDGGTRVRRRENERGERSRHWAFLDGDREEFDGRALQRNVGENTTNTILMGLDRLLEKCEKRGIRLLLTLTNFWEVLGGVEQYCNWFGVKDKSEFFRDRRIKEAYKRYARFVAERYKDNESVFAFADQRAEDRIRRRECEAL